MTRKSQVKYSKDLIDEVWLSCQAIPDIDDKLFRLDFNQTIIKYDEFGIYEADNMGWKIKRLSELEESQEIIVDLLVAIHWQSKAI